MSQDWTRKDIWHSNCLREGSCNTISATFFSIVDHDQTSPICVYLYVFVTYIYIYIIYTYIYNIEREGGRERERERGRDRQR